MNEIDESDEILKAHLDMLLSDLYNDEDILILLDGEEGLGLSYNNKEWIRY